MDIDKRLLEFKDFAIEYFIRICKTYSYGGGKHERKSKNE